MRAVIVFCEGHHDIVFATRSLGVLADAVWHGEPIAELPSPFGPVQDPRNPRKPKAESVIARRYANRSLEDCSLQGAAHPPLPSFERIVELKHTAVPTLYVFVRSHGDNAANASMALLSDLGAVLGYGVVVRELAAAFLFDADDLGVEHRENDFAMRHSAILETGRAPRHGQWQVGTQHPIGLYIFHDAVSKTGTLEDSLAPLVEAEWPARWAGAEAYLAQHEMPDDPVCRKRAERLKAQLGITGQFRFPGDPMTQLIGRDGLPGAHFNGAASQALVDFLTAVPW
ncbi:MAG: hypothetical protein RBU37_13625 [Myxococcota bacterium]|jgi:hypothetical protein|nr:hypothetical protein [Myxococcota bacterium]